MHIGAKHQYATQPTRVEAATPARSRLHVRTRHADARHDNDTNTVQQLLHAHVSTQRCRTV